MSLNFNDPMGQAVLDYAKNGSAEDIIVSSDICDDDIIEVAYLFRSHSEMPELEQFALGRCSGKILDVGAGAGSHAKYLQEQGLDVHAIDISPGCTQHLKSLGIQATQCDFFELNQGTYDTLLFLMNGIGIAGSLDHLDAMLIHSKKLVSKDGRIICDSSDIKYLYEDEDGGYWMDLSSSYYGNFRFQMNYRDHVSDWFDWLYVDFDNLQKAAERTGWKATKIYEDGDQYLAELILL